MKLITLYKINQQLRKVRKTDFYKNKKFGKRVIKNYNDFASLTCTTKEDLRNSYPFGTLAVDFKKVIETHMSSGTTGKPALSLYTKKDLDLSNKALRESWINFGITENSRVQFMMSYGLFSGAPINTQAIQSIGAFVLPAGIQSTLKQLQLMKDFKIDTIVATPSYYLHLIDQIEHNNIDWTSFNVRTGIAAGEVYSQEIKELISGKLNIKIFDHYGLCEVNTGIIYECKTCGNMVVTDSHIFAEVLDINTLDHAKKGELGELVLTSLEKDATPVIRYRTGDIVKFLDHSSKCGSCKGRTIISRINKRIGGTIFYKGIKLEPNELRDEILRAFKGKLFNRIKIIIPENLFINHPTIKIALISNDENIKEEIEGFIQSNFKVKFDVDIVEYDYFKDFINTKESIVEYVK